MRVLLVDPAADLLPALQPSLLSVPGLELYCAPDGSTAIHHAELLGGVDVLVTEVFLPGVDGISVRDKLTLLTPALHSVFLTRHDLGAYAEAIRDTPVLPIPVDPRQVLSAIRFFPAPKPAPESSVTPQHFYIPTSHRRAQSKPVETEATETTPVFVGQLLDSSRVQEDSPPASPALATELPPSQTPARTDAPQPADSPVPPNPRPPRAALYPGATLGPYHVFREDGTHPLGQRFAAAHTTLSRPVHLVVMDPASADVPELQSVFLADARAKAQVHHPSLLAVQEAGEMDGRIFYAIERIEAEPLKVLLERGNVLSVEGVLRIARTVAEGFVYLDRSKVAHRALTSADVLIAVDGSSRLRNLAQGGDHPAPDQAADLARFGAWLVALLPPETPQALRRLLERTQVLHLEKLSGWGAFLTEISALQRAPATTEAPSHTSRPNTRLAKGVLGLLVVATAGATALHFFTPEPLVPPQIQIPAGQYLVGTGRKITLEAFSIDATEITNRQYFKFVDWVRSHPKEAARFDHPEQPPRHSHIPPGWVEMFPEKARPETSPKNPLWELPVAQVSWWDAAAFAAWAGRILPSEEQWEASGRGTRGLLFPWGDEPEPELTNVSRAGLNVKPGEHNAPVAVQAMKDASAFGVTGLSGNVSEWTGTKRNAKMVAKGGHFDAPLLTLDASSAVAPETRSPHLGFRTATPQKTARP